MKHLFLISRKGILLLLCVLLTGCWDRKELDDLALVMASGIDQTEDGQIEVTLQIALPTGIPGMLQSSGKGQKPVLTVSAKGSASLELIARLQQQMSRRIYFGQRGIVLLGESFARQGVDQVLDTLVRFPESRYNSYILTTQGATAKEVLSAPYRLEVIPAIGMKSIEMNGFGFAVKIDRFMDAISTLGAMPVTGAIRLVEGGGASSGFQIDQVAVYRENRLAGYISGDNYKAFKMLQSQGKKLYITARIEPKGKWSIGTFTIEILKTRKKVRTSMKGGSPRIEVDFWAKARVVADDSTLDMSKIPNLVRAEKIMADEIQDMMTGMIAQTQNDLRSDVLGFGKMLHIQHPYVWKKLKDNWASQYPDVPVRVKVHLRIAQSGKTQKPGHMPE